MRVHELAKQLSSELGKTIASSELLVMLSKKKEGLKPQSSIDEDLIQYVRGKYIKKDSTADTAKNPTVAKKAPVKQAEPEKKAPAKKPVEPEKKPAVKVAEDNKKNSSPKKEEAPKKQDTKKVAPKVEQKSEKNEQKPDKVEKKPEKNQEKKPENRQKPEKDRPQQNSNRNQNNRNQNNKNMKGKGQPEMKKPEPKKVEPVEPVIKSVQLPESLTVSELASKIKVPVAQLIKKMFMAGKMYNVNSELDFDTAADIALEYNYIAEEEEKVDVIEELLKEGEEDESSMTPRPPVVCVMGHVE